MILNCQKKIYVSANFANVTVILPRDIPLRVKANSSFSTVHLPGQDMSSEYSSLHGAAEPLLSIYINSAFSAVIVKE